jgi:hypothetical protein
MNKLWRNDYEIVAPGFVQVRNRNRFFHLNDDSFRRELGCYREWLGRRNESGEKP